MSFLFLVYCAALGLSARCSDSEESLGDKVTICYPPKEPIYKFNMTLLEQVTFPFEDLKGKVVLVVNVASFCRYTPQYLQLNELVSAFSGDRNDRGMSDGKCHLQVLGFPSNQFNKKEPAFNFEIKKCLYYIRPGNQFKPMMPLSIRVDVNGENQIPLYTYLKESCNPINANLANESCSLWKPIKSNDVTWNFEKFLVDHHGFPAYRFTPAVEPRLLTGHIQKLIAKCEKEAKEQDPEKIVATVDLNNSKYEKLHGPNIVRA